ncbi:MAG: hypothetical protein E7286_02525 [Lachnospiraceae bacterium]|nr:hypothetical protein [Lachnospiraceae bacterium]
MKLKGGQWVLKTVLALFVGVVLIIQSFSMTVLAVENGDPVIVVSLGDSYSSGEGIEPFYGQEKDRLDKMVDNDWLAHRSKKSWPSLIEIPGISGTMSNYRSVQLNGESVCEWYFVASSGAVAKNITSKQQKKTARTYAGWFSWDTVSVELPKQIDVFDSITGVVDYVTMTIGGNDVGFADIITTCATKSTYLGSKSLEEKMEGLWNNIDTTKTKIKTVYEEVQQAAGPQADIIVAGYPQLLEKNGKGAVISQEEAVTVNTNVTKFNELLEELVSECAEAGMNIHFVDVEEEFNKDGGHQAYTEEPWINEIILGARDQDIDCLSVASAYSIHPNEEGAKAYARCVNAKIQEIENNKKVGTLSGKICMASDRVTPVADANISIYRNDSLYLSASASMTGNYNLTLPEGNYRVEINAPGYIPFTAYADVTYNNNVYMETFLMVAGSEEESGTVTGIINNAMTGMGVEGVALSVRKGWNNMEQGDILASTVTEADGRYSLTLPLGNYTVYAERQGFISTSFNIIVQKENSDLQNGTITPIISGNNFRIVLTWGQNPNDLDSHMEGTMTNGNHFHVYYREKYCYDGDIEVCNLDVDDTTSYGPETITLTTTTATPYYYYIYRYAGSGTVATSEAQVKVYQGENLVATFNVPTDLGSEDYWNVFAILNGELIIKNTITSSADIQYAN